MMKKSSSSKNEPCCSKACKKNTDNLNSKITELSDKLDDKELELIKKEKEGVDGKLEGFLTASKDIDSLIESQRSDKNKEGLGYNVVPPPIAQIYSSPKKDLSWTGLFEFADDTITDYSMPLPAIESTSDDAQNKNPSETGASDSTILSKPAIKFVKAIDRAAERSTTNKVEAVKKPSVRYVKRYRKPSKKPNKRVKKGTSRSQNKTHESFTPKPVVHRPFRPPVRPMRPNIYSARPNKPAHSYGRWPFRVTTQDLMIILTQRVQRLERELKARTHIHKVDRGRSMPVMAWVPKKV
nr:hypothetical protein [Tanacetum cinerariifolium]